MGKHRNIEKSRKQKRMRRARNEHAFIFTKDLSECLARVGREDWEDAISLAGGNPADAAEVLGIKGVPRNAKALWGRSEAEAKAIYVNWQRRKSKKKAT